LNLTRLEIRGALTGAAFACLATVASAQSSVTVYGQIGAGVGYAKASGNGADTSSTQLTDNLMAASYLGFTGTEDLGNGLRAAFRLEMALAPDTGNVGGNGAGGTRTFNRQSWVGLGNAENMVTLGRQFHAGVDRIIRTLDVNQVAGNGLFTVPLALFGVNRFAANDNRTDNSVKYRLAMPGVLEAGASYGMGERTHGAGATAPVSGDSYSFDLAHTTQTYSLGAFYNHFDAPVGLPVGGTPDHDLWGVGGNVQLGDFRPYLAYYESHTGAILAGRPTTRDKILHVGLSWTPAATAFRVTAAYYHDKGTDLNNVADRDGTKDTFVLAGFYALSKRTELYTAYVLNAFEDGYKLDPVNQAAMQRTAAQDKVGLISVGVRHRF